MNNSFLTKGLPANLLIIFLSLIAFTGTALTSWKVIQYFPNSADEYAYIFQAKNLAGGKIYSKPHPPSEDGFPLQKYFYYVHIGENDGRYYGRFPCGYSLLLIPAIFLGKIFPSNLLWITNSIFAAMTVVLLFLAGQKLFDNKTAVIAAIIGIINPWFLFTGGSFFSHTSSGFFLGLFLFLFIAGIETPEQKQRSILFFISGFIFGFSVLIRFLDPFCFLIPVLIFYTIKTIGENNRWKIRMSKDASSFMAGGFFPLIFFLFYNWKLCGNPLITPYQFYNPDDPGARFVFINGDGSFAFNRIWENSWHETRKNLLLMLEWFRFSVLIALVPVIYFYKNYSNRELRFILVFCSIVFSQVILYLLYGGPAMNQYGPRYYYAIFIPLTLAVARTITLFPNHFRAIIIIILIFYSIIDITRKSNDVYNQIFERRNLYLTVEKHGIKNSVVFINSWSGTMPPCDLTRNENDFSNSVLYAQNLEGNYAPLIKYYKQRDFYEYHYDGTGCIGKLTKLKTFSDGSYSR